MISTWNLQWLNLNGERAYPITDWGTKLDKTGTVKIPDDFILALYFPVHAGLAVEPDKFFIRTLGVYATGYNVTLGYDDGTSRPPIVASVNIAKSLHTEFRSYALPGSDQFDDSVGKIVIGSLDGIDSLPPGEYEFTPAATPLETDAIRPSIRGISSITVVNGSDRSARLAGDIELVAGNNMRIAVTQTGREPPRIVFSAISGEGLNEACVCDEEGQGAAMRFINGIPPLPDGNFKMVGDDCLELNPIANGLSLVDKCSQPCCGCEELNAVVQQIDRFADGASTLRNYVNNLGAAVTQMSGVVLGSRLGDQGCLDC